MVVNASLPVLSEVRNDTVIFRNDMLTRNEAHPVIGLPSVYVGGDVAQFYERVPPVVSVERELHKQFEPGRIEVVCCLLVLVALLVDQFEGTRHDEALALLYAAGEVQVHLYVAVYVV